MINYVLFEHGFWGKLCLCYEINWKKKIGKPNLIAFVRRHWSVKRNWEFGQTLLDFDCKRKLNFRPLFSDAGWAISANLITGQFVSCRVKIVVRHSHEFRSKPVPGFTVYTSYWLHSSI